MPGPGQATKAGRVHMAPAGHLFLTDWTDPGPEQFQDRVEHLDAPFREAGTYQSSPIAVAISATGGSAPYQAENARAACATSIARPS